MIIKTKSIMNQSYLLWIFYSLLLQQAHCQWPDICRDSLNTTITLSNKCYVLENSKKHFFEAVNFCKAASGNLAVTTNTHLLSLLTMYHRFRQEEDGSGSESRFWLGALDIEGTGEGPYTSVTGIEQNFTSLWASHQSSKKIIQNVAHCVVFDHYTYKLYNENCFVNKKFYCEFTPSPCKLKDITVANADHGPCPEDKNFPKDTNISISCISGYYLLGPSQVTCKGDGQWSEMPRCILACPKPRRTLAHASLLAEQSIYGAGSKVIYLCDNGYVSINNPRATHFQSFCNERGMWVPPIRDCTSEEPQQLDNVEAWNGETITLDCIPDLETVKLIQKTEDDRTPLFWLKDSQILSNSSSGYTHSSRKLIIAVTENAVGIYTCIILDRPAKKAYHLKIKPTSCDVSFDESENLQVKEGSSILLLCPHDSSFNSFTWFKDNDRYQVKGDEVLLPDHSLYIKNVTYENNGIYMCEKQKRESFCAINRTIHLRVMMKSFSIKCGTPSPEHDRHPWAASLWLNDELAPFCYGTLFHEHWVITTAHCLTGFNRKRQLNLYVRFHNDSSNKSKAVDVMVKMVKTHPLFSKKRHINDIGLLQLQTPIAFSETIRPICIATTSFTKNNACNQSTLLKGTVVGWGPLEKDDYDDHNRLTESLTLVNDNKRCFPAHFTQSDKILCLEKSLGTPTTSAGDAGSPFEIVRNGRTFLFGIHSWGDRANLIGRYDYFTNVSHFFPWINSVLKVFSKQEIDAQIDFPLQPQR